MDSLFSTLIISTSVFVLALGFQYKYFIYTKQHLKIFQHFFRDKTSNTSGLKFSAVNRADETGEEYPCIRFVGNSFPDLVQLIKEINTYLFKTKGTSDYEFIRNKVERKLNMRLDQASVHLAFPTYIGLMGTFGGVFLGIIMFLFGFDDTNSITDASIKNLLIGVLVSMSTSLIGLLLTTINNHSFGEARKQIEDDKNEFYDFIQTEVTKTASASLVSAISKLHDTVDKFEPAFSSVIEKFQRTFDNCTRAFGDNFEKNVVAVAGAVEVMGQNMDKINANISLQQKLLNEFRSRDFIRGIDKYVEASDKFVGITQSLKEFEKARRIMLAAAQETIEIQNQYNESLRVPREIAVKLHQIFERITTFEKNLNALGPKLSERQILGNEVLTLIQNQVNSIAKKGKVIQRYMDMSDSRLDEFAKDQDKLLKTMLERSQQSLQGQIDGFENMIKNQTEVLEKHHEEFIKELQTKFNIDEVRADFSNLKKLDEIAHKLQTLSTESVKSFEVRSSLAEIKKELEEVHKAIKSRQGNAESLSKGLGWFGRSRK